MSSSSSFSLSFTHFYFHLILIFFFFFFFFLFITFTSSVFRILNAYSSDFQSHARNSSSSFVGPSVRPLVCPSVRPLVRPSVGPSIRRSNHQSIQPSIDPSICPLVGHIRVGKCEDALLWCRGCDSFCLCGEWGGWLYEPAHPSTSTSTSATIL